MLPQYKVERVFLGAGHGHTLAGTQIVERFTGEFAVTGELAHGEVDVAVAALIGQAFVFQRTDEVEHFLHVFGGAGFFGRSKHAEGIAVFVHGSNVTIRQLLNGFTTLVGAVNDFVVDIGNVAHVLDLITLCHQPAVDHIEHDHDPGMAQVTEVVNGHPADVHTHLPRMNRLQRSFFTSEGVIDRDHDRQRQMGDAGEKQEKYG